MGAPNQSTADRSLPVPESAWPEAGIILLLLPILLLEWYDFSLMGWNIVGLLSVLMLVLVSAYWFARSLGKRILHEETSQIVAEKIFYGLHLNRVTIPKTEIEKVGVHVIRRRGNRSEVQMQFYRLSAKRVLIIKASLQGQEAAVEFIEQVRRFVEGWSSVEIRTTDATS